MNEFQKVLMLASIEAGTPSLQEIDGYCEYFVGDTSYADQDVSALMKKLYLLILRSHYESTNNMAIFTSLMKSGQW